MGLIVEKVVVYLSPKWKMASCLQNWHSKIYFYLDIARPEFNYVELYMFTLFPFGILGTYLLWEKPLSEETLNISIVLELLLTRGTTFEVNTKHKKVSWI